MSFVQWLIGIAVTVLVGVLSYNAGARTERARAKHAREERREKELEEWRDQGAAAIAGATRDLDAVMEHELKRLSRDERFTVVAAAQESWRETSGELMRLAAAHTDENVMTTALRARTAIDLTFTSVARAAALRPLPAVATKDGLRELLDAVKDGNAEFANEEQLRAAWDAAQATQEEAFRAMGDLRKALHAAVESGP